MQGLYELDGQDMFTSYGFVPDKGCSDSLLTPPKPKNPTYVNDWAEEDNLEYDDEEAVSYEAREIVLKGHIVAKSERTLWEKYNGLISVLSEPGTHTIESLVLGVSADVFYKNAPPPVRLTRIKGTTTIACKVELTFQEVISE